MAKLICCRKPFPNEYFYGYMVDLKIMNEIKSFKTMRLRYFSPQNNSHIHVSWPSGLSVICENIENQTFPSLKQAISMTTFHNDTTDFPIEIIQKMSETMIYPECKAIARFSRIKPKQLNICPECWEEDKKIYGRSYLHVDHQMYGVTVCRKHCRSLQWFNIDTIDDLELNSPQIGTEYIIKNLESEVEYAQNVIIASEKREKEWIDLKCENCDKEYFIHIRSYNTYAGCPFCAAKKSPNEWLAERVNYITNGNYTIMDSFDSFGQAYVVDPINKTKKKVADIIYGNIEHFKTF